MPTETCIFCGRGSRRLFSKYDIPIRACNGCGLRFAEYHVATNHVQTHYGDDYFSGGSAGYVDYSAGRSPLIRRGVKYANLVARHVALLPNRRRVLDIGAAAGYVVKGFVNSGWIGEGLEPNESLAAQAECEFGFRIHNVALEHFVATDTFDLVNLLQVLSHFANPQAAIAKTATLLNVGGHCLVETWNYKSLTAKLSGQSWHQYSPPTVLYWFTPQLIDQMFRAAGFRKIAAGLAHKHISGRQAKALAKHAASGSLSGRIVRATAGLIPDRLSVPYPGNDCFWALYQRERAA